MNKRIWPSLPHAEWQDTYATLHLWTQVVGKIRLKLAPFVNHWWETAFYLSPNGLRTSLIPFGHRQFEIEFNFMKNLLSIQTTDGGWGEMALESKSVAVFYSELMNLLISLGLGLHID